MEKTNIERSDQPGVSGKSRTGSSWFNAEEYHQQRDSLNKMDEAEKGFAQSTGANLVGRTDLENQGDQASTNVEEQEIFEALKRSPEVDVSHVKVKVENKVVTLEGTADDAKEARAMKKIVENIPGVSEVISHLHVLRGTEI